MTADNVIWAEVHRWRALLDEQNGTDRLELTCSIMKIAEEAGEATQAWIGVLGQNPRKGVTHTVDDVIGELTDVVFTSLVAIASLGADPRDAVAAVAAKAATYRSGLARTTAGSPPTGPGPRMTAGPGVSPQVDGGPVPDTFTALVATVHALTRRFCS
ncbi:MazG-like family protein [Actinoplanes sp. GCM10030250]|uniref:MazG-like family protein n=1 Tax=Actinoplanes sp. GCM10030250 TaxID=3273376 RepID=UPI0036097E1D